MRQWPFALLFLMSPVYAAEEAAPPPMPLTDQEKYEALAKANAALDSLQATTTQMVVSKTNHCMKAIGDSAFCGCFAQNVFVDVTFTQYVEFFGFGATEFDSKQLSPSAKNVYDNIRQTRDKCVKWKDKPAK